MTQLGRALRQLHLLTLAVVGLALLVDAIPQLHAMLGRQPWDLNVDRAAAQAFLDGYSPFTPEGAVRSGAAKSGPAGNGHPPTTSFWVLPIARLTPQASNAVLSWTTALLLFVELIVILQTIRCPLPIASAWVALGYVLGCSFMPYHFSVGQMSGLIGFLFFVGWAAGRRGDDWLAGAALGAACTMKLFPGVMVFMFLVARRWRAVVAAAAFYLAVAVIMTARFGLGSWPRFFAQQPIIANMWMDSVQNQSIHGIVLRLFWPVCGPHGPVLAVASLISTALSAALLALCTWVCWRTVRGRGFDISYALFVVLSIVTSQWTWEHYTIIYVLPVLLLAAELARAWRAGENRARVGAMAAGLVAVVASWRIDYAVKAALQRSVRAGLMGDHARLHLYDVLNWGPGILLFLLLLGACFTERRRLCGSRAPDEALRPEASRPGGAQLSTRVSPVG